VAVGEKFVTKALFEEWVRNLERKLYELKILAAKIQAETSATFVALPDTPNNYTGAAGRPVIVSASEDGLSFGGRMVLDLDTAAVSDPPTAGELDGVFGSRPDGFLGLLKDIDGPLWLVGRAGSAWWVVEFTEA